MTIEKIKTEKDILAEKIAKVLKGFHQATDCWASGRFYSQEFVIEDAQGYKFIPVMSLG